jgi:KDO2-lipid IV(A) lauroyltransferase
MSKPPFAHRAEAVLVRIGLGILRRLRPETASILGGRVARFIGPLLPPSKISDINLRMAMPELNAAQRKKITAEAWENLGSTTAELVHIGELQETSAGPGYIVTGWDENVAPELAKGIPAIFFTGHIGNWEIIPPAGFSRGYDAAFMYRAANNKLVDDIILGLREASFKRKITMFPKGASGARQAYVHMMHGGNLSLMVDQKLDNGISVPFFGIPAMTAPALASFALKFRSPVLPVYCTRIGPARLQVVFEKPLALPDTGDKEADVLTLTTEMNQTLERWIRKKPGAWLWLHRRWPKALYKKR